jgi:UDP-N-acetylglucosamine transferase subunit ALG13
MRRIVVSLGTDHHRFDRLLDWAEHSQAALGTEFVVQRGATDPRPGVQTIDYLPADELEALMRSADAVVCHGGPGTISMTQRAGHRPVVVARDPLLGEHVDDHQMRYAARLAEQGIIDVAHTRDELVSLLAVARPRPRAVDHDAVITATVAAFSRTVDQLLAGTLPPRDWRRRIMVKRIP